MTYSIHALELAPSSGLEVAYEGLEPDREDLEHVPDSASTFQKEAKPSPNLTHNHVKRWKTKYRWAIIGGLVIAILTAVIVGPVIGTRNSR